MNLKVLVFLGVAIFLQTIVSGQDDEESDLDIIKQFEQTLGKNPDEDLKEDGASSPSVPVTNPVTNPNRNPNPNLPVVDNKKEVTSGISTGPSQSLNSSLDVIPESDPCSCVKYFLCDIENGAVIDNGDVIGLIDIRLGGLAKGSPCDHYFDICCKNMKNGDDKVLPQQPTFQHSSCGKRNIGGVGFRITGAMDGEAQFGEFPWMAAIVKQEPQGDKQPLNIFQCGGSLFHPKVVLTAAHCVFGKNAAELKVRLGEWDTQTPDELYPHQDRFVKRIVVHEDYYAGALYNDIALLFLDEEVKFAPNVDTVCLPPPNVNFDGQRCFASGWGKDTFGQEGKYQIILKKVDVPIVPRRKCQSGLRRTRLGPFFRLDESFVCAGGEPGRDTCRGDGGSPLVCKLPDSQSYVQFGIVAWGIGCGEDGTPGVYVNVPKFVPWIEKQLKEAKLDTKYHKASSQS